MTDHAAAYRLAGADIALDLSLLLELQRGVPRPNLGGFAAEVGDERGGYERLIWRLERVDQLIATSGKATYEERVDEAIAWTSQFVKNMLDAAARAGSKGELDPQP